MSELGNTLDRALREIGEAIRLDDSRTALDKLLIAQRVASELDVERDDFLCRVNSLHEQLHEGDREIRVAYESKLKDRMV